MKIIIFNKKLREIKNLAKKSSITYPDFFLTKKLANSVYNDIEGSNLISILAKKEITPKQYDFLLDLYVNNKESFNILKDMNLSLYDFDTLKELFIEDPNLLNVLIKYPNLIKKETIQFYSKDLLINNTTLLDKLNSISIEEVEPYINQLHKCPQNLEIFLNILIKKMEILKPFLENIDNPDINNIYSLYNIIEDEDLKNFLINNINNPQTIKFVQDVSNNLNNEIKEKYKKYHYYKNYFNELQRLSPESDKNIIKSFIIYKLKGMEINDAKNIMFKALLNLENADILIERFFDCKNDTNDFDAIKEQLALAIKLIDSPSEKDTLFSNFAEHYFSEDLFIDYNTAYNCIRNNQANLIKSNLTNINDVKNLNPTHYTYIDNNGNKIEKEIQVKVIDTPDFQVLIHGIAANKDTICKDVTNYEIGNKLISNPNVWQENATKGNPQISTSLFTGCLNPFSSDVILGFSTFPNKSLISTYSRDGATQMKESQEELIFKTENFTFVSYNILKKSFDYNEILIKRFNDGAPLLPDYIIIQSDELHTANHLTNAKRWAAYYDIPLVIIDKEKIGAIRKNNLNNLVNNIIASGIINDEGINVLKDQIKLTNWCFEYDKTNFVDPYIIVEQLQKNIPLNKENALNMLKLLKTFNYLKYSPEFETIYNGKENEISKFSPCNLYGKNNEEQIQIALQRQQLTKEYINKCKEIILANEQQIGYSK